MAEDNTIIQHTWLRPTLILCAYGFLKDMKPSEPFLTPYLNSTYKNLDVNDLSHQVYPIWTYSYLVFLFLVFLLTDFLRYKPMIIIESIGYLCTRFILIWGEGIPIMQGMQVVYGLASAAEIAYYSYIYAVIGKDHYGKATSYIRAATLLGRGVSDILGQILISTHATNYLVLNYISLVSVTMAVIASFLLPKVTSNIFLINGQSYEEFSNDKEEINHSGEEQLHETSVHCWTKWKQMLTNMFESFKRSYSNRELLMWSLWWAFALCGGLQVENYVMNLWSDIIGSDSKDVYNGAVFACGTLCSALFVFLFSLMKVQWNYIAQVMIAIFSIVDTVLLLIMAKTSNIWIAYACYVLFRALFAFILTVASYQIALHVELNGFGLIFGWNTFIALVLQSLLTFIVTDKKGLDLDQRMQFIVYSGYFGCIALMFMLRPCYYIITKCFLTQALCCKCLRSNVI